MAKGQKRSNKKRKVSSHKQKAIDVSTGKADNKKVHVQNGKKKGKVDARK